MAKPYSPIVHQASEMFDVPVELIHAVIRAESGGDPLAHSPAGAQGLMQLMPGTARGLGVRNSYDPRQNIMGGTRYLANLLKQFHGDTRLALAGYNAGPGAARKAITAYPETRQYVQRVLGYAGQRGMGGGGGYAHGAAAPVQGAFVPQSITIQQPVERRPAFEGSSRASRLLSAAQSGTDYKDVKIPLPPQFVAAPSGMPAQQPAPAAGFPSRGNPFFYLNRQFGLNPSSTDHDAPGVHVEGSYHYRPARWGGVQGYDYGDRSNSRQSLINTARWARANRGRVAEMFFDPLGWYIKNGKVYKGAIGGHGDHLHLALR